ncbi:MAG: MotA/TolQ/ExbB proton channel family protein [Flavobacteriales bacterium]|jgi:biopolymer transport protein ExbB
MTFNLDFLFFLQENLTVSGATVAADTTSGSQPAGNFDLVDQLIQGWYIYIPQLILSIVAVYIFVERSLAVSKAGKEDPTFMSKIKEYINGGKLDSARNLCATVNTPMSAMIEKGISRIGKPLEDISKAIENTGKIEIAKMERNTSILATISAVAPMFGFLGTVFGVITIFRDIAEAGSLQIGTVSEGLYLKMISSAVGLIVGMIAYVGYNTITSRIGKVINKMESNAVEFLDILEQPSN